MAKITIPVTDDQNKIIRDNADKIGNISSLLRGLLRERLATHGITLPPDAEWGKGRKKDKGK